MSSMVIESGKKVRSTPWVEKHRPHKVDEIAHQDEVILTLKKSIETGNLPHLLFHGPPGTSFILYCLFAYLLGNLGNGLF